MGGVVDVDTLQAEGPSAPYEADSWDNQRVDEGTVLDGAGLVHEVAERYRERVQARVVMDTREVEEGRHCGKTIWARRPLVVDQYGGASGLSRSRGVEGAFAKTRANCPPPGQREVRAWDDHVCLQQRVDAGNGASV